MSNERDAITLAQRHTIWGISIQDRAKNRQTAVINDLNNLGNLLCLSLLILLRFIAQNGS